MGRKSWDTPERRAERRRGEQAWRDEVADELLPLTSLGEVIAEYGFTQAEIDAAPD